MPRLNLVDLEAQYKAAQAALALAMAERDRGVVRAPWDGIVTDVPVDVGQAAFSMAGQQIAQLMSLDPMLAVVEVAERQLAGIEVGEAAEVRLITGQTVTGEIRYVSKTASQTTRTYRVEVETRQSRRQHSRRHHRGGDGAHGAGAGRAHCALGLDLLGRRQARRAHGRTQRDGAFVPVQPVEDEQAFMWVAGIADGARVIVQGQDFVREGQSVQAVAAHAETTATITE